MKRILALALIMIMTLSCIACRKKEVNQAEDVKVKDAVELLTTVWDNYPGEKFAVAGGDYENSVMDAPGAFDYTNLENLDAMLGMPKEGADLIDDAASLMHMMNANTFTAGVFHVTDSKNTQAVADIMKDSILNRQWICGFPDTLLIVSVGSDYVVSAFGVADIMDNFETALTDSYGAKVLYEESLSA